MAKDKFSKKFKNGNGFKLTEIDLISDDFDDIETAIEEEKFRNRHKRKNKPNHRKYEKNDDYDI